MFKKSTRFLLLTVILFGSVPSIKSVNNNDIVKAEAKEYDPTSGAIYYADAEQYYQGIDPNLTGEDLMDALALLNDNGRVGHDYDELANIYQYSDVTESGKMRLAYTGTEKSFTPGSMPGGCNKEHVWAASWYGPNGNRLDSKGTPGADAHNVWPCASELNSKRGSCAFDELDPDTSFRCYELTRSDYNYGIEGDPDTWVYSTATDYSNGNSRDVLYPSKGHRGETARCMLYVATSYHLHNNVSPVLIDEPEMNSDGRCGRLSTLLKWHFQELPTEWEIKRNQEIATRYHHNRNPFIDHPEYAAKIYGYMPEPGQDKPTDAVLNVINTYGKLEYADPIGIEIIDKEISIAKGEHYQIKAKALPEAARQAFVYSSENYNVANVNSNGLITAIGKGDCRIKIAVKDNPNIFDYINVKVKEISHIELSGEPIKKEYISGDTFDPSGLKVTAFFDDNSNEIIPNESVVWTDSVSGTTLLQAKTTSVIATYADKTATYEGITVIEKQFSSFYRINEKKDDYSGDYLLVNEDSKVILDGDAQSYGKSNSRIQTSVEIKNGIINGKYDNKTFNISKSGNGYKIKSSSGKIIGAKASSNFETGSYINNIDFVDGEIKITCKDLTLRYNANYFRYYENENVGNPVALYKADFNVQPDKPNPPVDQDKPYDIAKNYAIDFINANVCGTDDNTKAISNIFLQQRDKYLNLPKEAQEILANSQADKDSQDPIKKCLAKYDRIIFLHGEDSDLYPDFMNRSQKVEFNPNLESRVNVIESNIILILILGSLGLILIGILLITILLIKQKKF